MQNAETRLDVHLNADLKYRVVREAATLLYFGAEKEYKQAKEKAAETLGTHFLPSNLEVALELNKIAEENEGVDQSLSGLDSPIAAESDKPL